MPKHWVNPTRDFYNKGTYYAKGNVFVLPDDMTPPRGSFEVKPVERDPVAEALAGKPFTVISDKPTGGADSEPEARSKGKK
jgi:hypothetical protein